MRRRLRGQGVKRALSGRIPAFVHIRIWYLQLRSNSRVQQPQGALYDGIFGDLMFLTNLSADMVETKPRKRDLALDSDGPMC